jgi:hypothetical protein
MSLRMSLKMGLKKKFKIVLRQSEDLSKELDSKNHF